MAKPQKKGVRASPCITITMLREHYDFVEVRSSETGLTFSGVIREALAWFIQYHVKPEIVARIIAEQKAEAQRLAKSEPAKPAKVGRAA